jgi:hypothetical protein
VGEAHGVVWIIAASNFDVALKLAAEGSKTGCGHSGEGVIDVPASCRKTARELEGGVHAQES